MVHLTGGEELAAEVVVVGVGVRPDTGWLTGSGVDTDERGTVIVDNRLRTSLPDVYAVGDCAAFASRRYGRRLHVEHWTNAMQAPRVAVADMLDEAAEYDPVPYVWSEQFGRMIQYIGHHPVADGLTWRGDPAGATWSACWLRGERLVALLAVGRPRDIVQGRKLIEQAAPVDQVRLADPDTPLRECVAG
jgi:3-phenylpropionate/trans-cinnamate dioxygenase ferredoxin reductase component